LFNCETNYSAYVKHSRIRSWKQQALDNDGKGSCSRKQRRSFNWSSTVWHILIYYTCFIDMCKQIFTHSNCL